MDLKRKNNSLNIQSQPSAWAKIIRLYEKDLYRDVLCPACGTGYLIATDVPFSKKYPQEGGERYFDCSNCQHFESKVYKTPPKNWLQ